MPADSWSLAVELVASFLKQPARLSHLLERVPTEWDAGRRRTCQSLLFGTVRHWKLLEKLLDEFLRKRPKPQLWSHLLVASCELLQDPQRQAKIVHHAVDRIGQRFSKAEKGLANAVLRKAAARLPELLAVKTVSAGDLAWRYSHPVWLVERWLKTFGREATLQFLEWNQKEASVFARWQGERLDLACLEELGGLEVEWFKVQEGAWAEISGHLREGRLYVQNPATALAPLSLVKGTKGGRVLDLCAAPGGKSLLLEKFLPRDVSEIVAVDLPGARLDRLRSNLARYFAKRVRVVDADVLELTAAKLDGRFQGVLLDAPCSNSGVLQHKVDARWRQSPDSLSSLLTLQAKLLAKAATLVESGGVLVYSTCSVDPEENGQQVERFLQSEIGSAFRLESSELSLPWESGYDGAGVFRLRRASEAR